MPYILLVLGLLVAGIALYRFFLRATARQVKALFLAIAGIAVGLASLFLAVTGRLGAAIGIFAVLWPLAVAWFKNRGKTKAGARPPSGNSMPMTRKEAYEVLGLPEGAGEDAVRDAHLRLMKKLHPDQSGSDWLAQRINAAKDLLLDP